MRRKEILPLGIVLLLLIWFASGRNSGASHGQSTSRSVHQGVSVPDHLVYDALFKRVDSLNVKTKALQAEGRISSRPYFPLKDEANLTAAQANQLSAIATDCLEEVKKQDQKAKVIIDAFRRQFPGGKIPQGEMPPSPPPELKTLWDERNAIILRGRDRLRAAFGEQEFYRFDQHTKLVFGADAEYIRHRNAASRP